MWVVFSVALLANVSFFLYCRQCRYYSLSLLLYLVIVYQYLNWNGKYSGIGWMLVPSAMLLWVQYLQYAALYAILACDYLLFARHRRKLTAGQWLLLVGPQVLMGLAAMWTYNPLGADVVQNSTFQRIPILDKLTLVWWNFRDLDKCEFCVGLVMLARTLVYCCTRDVWILRGAVAGVVYTTVISLLSPQPVAITSVADVRYLVPLIPLCIVLSSSVIAWLTRNRWPLALPCAVFVFGTNILNHPLSPELWASRPLEFIHELASPRDTSIDLAVRWIRNNVRDGESIWVVPDYMESSLMYHAPRPVYAWHLSYPPQEQFAFLPPIHFFRQELPDYFVVFGPAKLEVEKLIKTMEGGGIEYRLAQVLDVYWDDQTRPEIFWRSFRPTNQFRRECEAVYIYRHAR